MNDTLTPEEIEGILRIAKDKGYLGFSRGEFHFEHRKPTNSLRSVQTNLTFPEVLESEGLYRLSLKYKNLLPEIGRVLSDVPLEVSRIQNNDTSEIVKEEYSKSAATSLEDLCIFKTYQNMGNLDPAAKRSGGFSILLIDPKTRTIVNGSRFSIDGMLEVRGTSRKEVLASPDIPLIMTKFNPYTPEVNFKAKFDELGGRELMVFNSAIPPEWLSYSSKNLVTPKLSGTIKKIVEHLFPNSEERELVLDWVHYAIFKRNGTVLCLAGDRGTGKSTFVEILSCLIGSQYSEIVSEAILTDKFNNQFANKRLLVFEEVALAENKAVNKIKAWCNSKISIEEKGSNAYSADNFTSMVFLVNRPGDLKIAAEERRFSIPVVAEENLLTAVSEKELSDFKMSMIENTPEFIKSLAEFGLFIKDRKPKFSEYVPIKGENFMRVTDLSLKEWQGQIKEYLRLHGVPGEIIPIGDMIPTKTEKDAGAIFPNRRDTIDSFLRDHRYLGKYKLADIVDLTEKQLEKIYLDRASNGGTLMRPHKMSGKTKRLYGLMPRTEFLKVIRENNPMKEEGEDLL